MWRGSDEVRRLDALLYNVQDESTVVVLRPLKLHLSDLCDSCWVCCDIGVLPHIVPLVDSAHSQIARN